MQAMSRAFAVFSAIGADRVGIVDDLSGLVADAGGNIEESKMAVLGSEFAVMMLVSMDEAAMNALATSISKTETQFGLKLGLVRTKEPTPPERGRPYILETVSLDGRGIVHAVSAVLRGHGINIEDLETETERAPLTGAPMFRMRANIVLGPSVSISALRRELEGLEAGQDIDIVLMPVVPTRLE